MVKCPKCGHEDGFYQMCYVYYQVAYNPDLSVNEEEGGYSDNGKAFSIKCKHCHRAVAKHIGELEKSDSKTTPEE